MFRTVFRSMRNGVILAGLMSLAIGPHGFAQTQDKQDKKEPTRRAESISLTSLDADKVAAVLDVLLGGGKDALRVEFDSKNNLILVEGSADKVKAVKSIVNSLGDKRTQNAESYLALVDYLNAEPQATSVLATPYLLSGTAQMFGDYLLAASRDTASEPFGATLTPLSDALRAQLKVPAGQGLLVADLQSDGPSASAGLKRHDILLTLGDHPLAAPDDLTKHLKAAGDGPVPLKVLRAGKKITLQVRPEYRVTLSRAVAEPKKEYYIGVQLEALDDALRAQLNFPAGKGVLVSSVVDNSPAQAAGIKPHDIILEYGGKAIENPQMLAAQVQAVKDKPGSILILREGKSTKLDIAAALRNVDSSSSAKGLNDALRVYSVRTRALDQLAGAQDRQKLAQRLITVDKEASLARQIEDLRQQVQTLRDTIDRLNATIKATPTTKK